MSATDRYGPENKSSRLRLIRKTLQGASGAFLLVVRYGDIASGAARPGFQAVACLVSLRCLAALEKWHSRF